MQRGEGGEQEGEAGPGRGLQGEGAATQRGGAAAQGGHQAEQVQERVRGAPGVAQKSQGRRRVSIFGGAVVKKIIIFIPLRPPGKKWSVF